MKWFLAAILIGLFNFSLSAQYKPLLSDESQWSQLYSRYDEQAGPRSTEIDHFVLGNDTLMNGETWKKLYFHSLDSATSFRNMTHIGWLHEKDSVVRARMIREVNWIPYYIIDNPGEDTITFTLYDFSLEAGDSFIISDYLPRQLGDSLLIVDTTYYTHFRADSFKTIVFDGQPRVKWVEGIGSHHGLFGYQRLTGGWDTYRFVCFSNSARSYDWNAIDSLELLNNLDNQYFRKFHSCYRLNPVSVRSIPETDWAQFHQRNHLLDISSTAETTCKLLDLQGRILLSSAGMKNNHLLDTHRFSGQVCILVIQSENDQYSKLIRIQ